MKFNKTSHRKVSEKNSFYLKSNSVNINCYWPYDWQNKKYLNSSNIENAKNIIRFEVQCKYLKIYNLSENIKKSEHENTEIIYDLLSDEMSADIIRHYFHNTIGKGNYFTLDNAIKMVRLKGFRCEKEERLISTLQRVNSCWGIKMQ